MRSKGIRLLAVLTVLAMAFAACAADLTPADAAETSMEDAGLGERIYELDVTEGFSGKINFYAGESVRIPAVQGTGNTFVLSMSGITENNTVYDSDADPDTDVNNWHKTTGYGFFSVNFKDFTSPAGNDYIWMYQKSTALSLSDANDVSNKDRTKAVAGTAYTERLSAWPYAGTFDKDDYAHDLGVLFPQDGSSILLEFYAAKNSEVEYQGDIDKDRKNLNSLTLIASFTIKTEDLSTLVDLDTSYPYSSYTKTNSNYKDWAFDKDTKALTGTIGSNLMFKGNGITAGPGITDSVMKDAGFTVKLVQGGKTLYFLEPQKALDAVTADATITLLDTSYSPESLAYTKSFALTMDLNGKELAIQTQNDKGGKIGEGLFEIANVKKNVKIMNGTISVPPTKVPEDQQTLSVIENFNTSTELSSVVIDTEDIRADPAIGWDTALFNRNGTLTISGSTRILGDAATFAIISDSYKDTPEADHKGSLVKIASNSVVVEGGMLVSYSSSQPDPWGAHELSGMGFDISAGKYTGVLAKGAITIYNTYSYAITDYDDAKYGDDMTFVLSGGVFVEYSALPYVAEGKTITIDDGGQGVPAGSAKEAKITGGTVNIDVTKLDSGKANSLVMENGSAITKLEADLGDKEVVLIGKGQALSGVKVTVSGAGHIAFYGFSAVSGTVTAGAGTSAQTVKLSGAVGEFTVSQGSIAVNTDWKGGTIYLSNGDILRLSGNIMENSYIDRDPEETSAEFSAKVIIEKGASKSLTIDAGKTLEVKTDGIEVEIEGTVTGEGTLKAAKFITVKDGGVLSSRVISAETNTVYSGGNINRATIDDFSKWTGKDAGDGFWTYNSKTLSLTNYNGTYNFAQIDGSLTGIMHIELNGNNVVTLSEPILRDIDAGEGVLNVLIGGRSLSSITTDGEGSLTFDVDISKVEGGYLSTHTAAIYGPITIIDGVSIKIKITGSNPDWTSEQKERMDVTGIEVTSDLEHFSSITDVSVMPGYGSERIFGIFVAGNMSIIGKTLQAEASRAIQADNISIRAAVVTVKGNVVLYDSDMENMGDLNVSSIGTINIDGGLMAKDVTASQKSLIGIKEAAIIGNLKNKGIVKIAGNVMVGGTIENLAEMQNDGYIGVFGEFVNDKTISLISGKLKNNGTLETVPMKQREELGAPVTTADITITDTPASAGYAKIKNIHIYDVAMKYNGEMAVLADVTVYKSEGYAEASGTFEGTVTPGMNGYTLELSGKTSYITVSYDSTNTEGPTKVGKAYFITVSGTVRVGDDNLQLQSNTMTSGSEAVIAVDTVKQGGLYVPSGANIEFTGGEVYNYGTINISTAADAKILGKDAALYGDIATSIENVTFEGFFNGTLTASGDGLVTVADVSGDVFSQGSVKVTGTMNGNVYAKKDVTVTGALTGDIETNGSVDIKKMTGSVTVVRATDDTGSKTLKADGESSVTVIYRTAYKATKEATEPTQYMASMNIAGDPKGLIIDLVKGSDATSSSDVVPGYFGFKATGELVAGTTVDMVLTKGRILVDSPVTLESRYYLQVLAGTTIEVSKSGGTFDVRKGSLKVSKDAEALFETGSGAPVKYGKLLFIMSVEIEGGAYTVYSDVAYALKNCDEGAELDVGESAEIDQDVTVKKNVNIILEDSTLTFGGRNVEMLEGAKITVKGTGKVVFKESGDNHSTAKEGEDIVYYSVSGIIVYGDNTVRFDKVRFTDDSTIQGVAATTSSAAKIKTDLELDEGAVYIAKGTGTGTITLKNDLNDVTKAEIPAKRMVFGSFIVSEGAVFDAVAINDTAATVLYKAYTGEPKIEKYVKYPTIVGVEGILNLTADTTVKGNYYGPGTVTLADGKTLVVDKAELPELEAEKLIPGTLNLCIVDTTDDANGYDFNNASSYTGTQSLVLTSGTFTVSGEKVSVMKVKGALFTGTAKATTIACLDELRVFESAYIYGDTVYIIGASSTLDGGYVGAKLIYKHDKPFADLTYDAVFEEDDYTIYAMFGYIDWDSTSNVIIADDVAVDTLDLSGRDVNIVIAEGAELKVMKLLIIGSPATLLSGEGSSIMGKVTIVEGLGAYIVAYADADLSSAEIVTWTDVPAPKYSDPVSSKLDVDSRVYATIYSAEADNLVLAKADSSLRPVIVGYVFTSWLNYNGDAEAKVGETNAYAGMKATNVTVTVKFTEGVTVYCNGEEFNIYNAPTKVKYNSVFNAKISDTSRYEGTPLVNGKNAFIVTEDATLTVSGVTPIPGPEPGPGGGDSGLSLINILLIVLVVLIGIMAVILFLRLRSV